MTYTRKNVGTCSVSTTVEIVDGIIKDVTVINGCDGNLKGIMSLLKGMKAEDAIERMEGITCGRKPTSCADQLGIGVRAALDREAAGAH